MDKPVQLTSALVKPAWGCFCPQWQAVRPASPGWVLNDSCPSFFKYSHLSSAH